MHGGVGCRMPRRCPCGRVCRQQARLHGRAAFGETHGGTLFAGHLRTCVSRAHRRPAIRPHMRTLIGWPRTCVASPLTQQYYHPMTHQATPIPLSSRRAHDPTSRMPPDCGKPEQGTTNSSEETAQTLVLFVVIGFRADSATCQIGSLSDATPNRLLTHRAW